MRSNQEMRPGILDSPMAKVVWLLFFIASLYLCATVLPNVPFD